MSFLRSRRRVEHEIREDEAYARCYGERGGDIVAVAKIAPHRPRYQLAVTGETLRRAFERRIDARGSTPR